MFFTRVKEKEAFHHSLCSHRSKATDFILGYFPQVINTCGPCEIIVRTRDRIVTHPSVSFLLAYITYSITHTAVSPPPLNSSRPRTSPNAVSAVKPQAQNQAVLTTLPFSALTNVDVKTPPSRSPRPRPCFPRPHLPPRERLSPGETPPPLMMHFYTSTTATRARATLCSDCECAALWAWHHMRHFGAHVTAGFLVPFRPILSTDRSTRRPADMTSTLDNHTLQMFLSDLAEQRKGHNFPVWTSLQGHTSSSTNATPNATRATCMPP